jgi:hypothetical protein
MLAWSTSQNVFGGVRDDNDDLLRTLINVDLPGGDLNLSVWKLLAISSLSFTGVPTLLGYLVQTARWHSQRMLQSYISSISDVLSRCYKYFILMLQK